MNSCTPAMTYPSASPRRFLNFSRAWTLASVAAVMCATNPVYAQMQPGLGLARNFPNASLRGNLTVQAGSNATLNGRAIRMAPGMRLFTPQNALVMMHTVQGQTFKVNYLIENSTGMLLSAWILTEGEAAQPRKGVDTVERNYHADTDPVKK